VREVAEIVDVHHHRHDLDRIPPGPVRRDAEAPGRALYARSRGRHSPVSDRAGGVRRLDHSDRPARHPQRPGVLPAEVLLRHCSASPYTFTSLQMLACASRIVLGTDYVLVSLAAVPFAINGVRGYPALAKAMWQPSRENTSGLFPGLGKRCSTFVVCKRS